MPQHGWQHYYTPPTHHPWQGRPEATHERLHQQVKLYDLTQDNRYPPGFVLLGFSSDTGVKRNHGRVGAAEGPATLRPFLANIPHTSAEPPFYDAGTIHCKDDQLEAAQHALAIAVEQLHANHHKPIVIGGGHEVAWGHYQGLIQHPLCHDLCIVNFDAHFDCRPIINNQGTSGTPFLQIANARHQAGQDFCYHCIGIQPFANTPSLINTIEQLGCHYLTAEDCQHEPQKLIQTIDALCQQQRAIYLTVCLDVFNQAYAPGVSAPQALGLAPRDLLPAITQLIASGNVISFDIAEYAPCYDRDHQTARLASHLVATYLHHSPAWRPT